MFNFTPFSDSIYVCHLSGTVAYFLDHLHIPRSEVKIEEINRQETEVEPGGLPVKTVTASGLLLIVFM